MQPESVTPISAGTEYYAFKIILTHDKSVGSEACAGCTVPACIVVNEVLVSSANLAEEILLVQPERQNYVVWQEEVIPQCPEATHVRPTTWGRLRSLYR